MLQYIVMIHRPDSRSECFFRPGTQLPKKSDTNNFATPWQVHTVLSPPVFLQGHLHKQMCPMEGDYWTGSEVTLVPRDLKHHRFSIQNGAIRGPSNKWIQWINQHFKLKICVFLILRKIMFLKFLSSISLFLKN